MTKIVLLYKYVLLTAIFFLVFGAPRALVASKNNYEIVVLGDVEGALERLNSFLTQSGVFSFDKDEMPSLNEGYKFVFMGDTVDWGSGEFEILRTLEYIKEQSPLDHISLLGNRDLNKLGLLFEATLEDFGPEKLQMILATRMGAGQAFKYRRKALSQMWGKEVSDQDVTNSFLQTVANERIQGTHVGLLSQYLRNSKVMHIDPPSRSIFVHGALTGEAFGRVFDSEEYFEDIHDWQREINFRAQENIEMAIRTNQTLDSFRAYQKPVPGTHANRGSLIYGRNFDESANPEMIPEWLQDKLLKQGIDTIFVGHTPLEVPIVISSGKFRMVFVDTSSSNNKNSAIVSIRDSVLKISYDSPIDIGRRVSYEHRLGEESLIGQKRESGWVTDVQNGKVITLKVNKDAGFKQEFTVEDISENCDGALN